MSNLFAQTSDETMRANILESWMRADAKCRQQGRDWYRDAHLLVTDLAVAADVSVEAVAGIMAVLSPRSAWGTNVQNTAAVLVEAGHLSPDRAVEILRAHNYRPADGVYRMHEPRGLNSNIAKARHIAETEAPAGIVSGQKVLSFWSNIADPAHSDAVTIDAWAASVAMGRRLSTAEMASLNPTQYARIADAYRKVADQLNVPAHIVQATTWCEIRGRNR